MPSLRGTFSLFTSAQTTSEPLNKAASISPGITPATKSLAMDTSAATPYTIMMIEGGISRPSVLAPPSEPTIFSAG